MKTDCGRFVMVYTDEHTDFPCGVGRADHATLAMVTTKDATGIDTKPDDWEHVLTLRHKEKDAKVMAYQGQGTLDASKVPEGTQLLLVHPRSVDIPGMQPDNLWMIPMLLDSEMKGAVIELPM